MDTETKWKSIAVWSDGESSMVVHDAEKEARETAALLIIKPSIKSVSVKEIKVKK